MSDRMLSGLSLIALDVQQIFSDHVRKCNKGLQFMNAEATIGEIFYTTKHSNPYGSYIYMYIHLSSLTLIMQSQ